MEQLLLAFLNNMGFFFFFLVVPSALQVSQSQAGIKPSSKAVKAAGVLTTGPPANSFSSLGRPIPPVVCLLLVGFLFGLS